MSAGEPGTIYDQRTGCWIMDPDFVPTRAHIATARARTVIRDADAIYMFEPSPLKVEEQIERGDALIRRINYWLAVPWVGSLVANLLSRRLDAITDKIEGELPYDEWGVP